MVSADSSRPEPEWPESRVVIPAQLEQPEPPRALRPRTVRIWAILASLTLVLSTAGMFVLRRGELGAPGQGAEGPAAVPTGDAVGEKGTCGGTPVAATREVRGMWLTTVLNIDWPSQPGLDTETVKREYVGWLDLAEQRHHNAIYVHVRPSGDAFWPSRYAPWSEWLTGKRDGVSPGWDPLEWMIEETHRRNIAFYAWFNPYRGTQPAPRGPGDSLAKLAPNHPLVAHPDWVVAYPAGTSTSRLYFDPGIPEARRYVEDSMLEAVQRYDIDGVEFDDFFYPYPEAGQDFADDRSYAAYGGGFASKADWRRDNVNTLIREMNERIKSIKPWVRFGIAPFGIWRNSSTDPAGSPTRGLQSYDEIYADTRTWVKQRWVDSISPQLYWSIGLPAADHAVLLPWWSRLVEGTGVQLYIAYGDYRIGESGPWSDPGQIDKQMTLAKQYNVDGSVHFSAKSVRDDELGAVSRYSEAHYGQPALLPTMRQLPADPPAAPVVRDVRAGTAGQVTVTWRPGAGTTPTSYAVYRRDPGDQRAQLIATARATGAEQSFVDQGAPAGATYCVSGLDRTANEGRISAPRSLP